MLKEKTRSQIRLSCRTCGKSYFVHRSRAEASHYCSFQCSGKGRRKGATRNCEQCGTPFYAFRSQIKIGQGKFCSIQCVGLSNAKTRKTGSYKKCLECGNKFYVIKARKTKAKFCSVRCAGRYYTGRIHLSGNAKQKLRIHNLGKHRGLENHQWKGGITPLKEHIRKLDEYKQWRTNVFQRDDWTCLTCSTRGSELQAHHIKAFGIIIFGNHITNLDEARACAELWDTDNGITLCYDCHLLTRTKKQGSDHGRKSQYRKVS